MTTPPFEPPPGDEQQHVRPEAAAPTPACPRCGAPHDPLQEYCLECGQRLVPLPGATTTRETWTRESPIWLWLALGSLLLVALAAGAIVALAAADDDDAAPVGTVTTEPVGTEPVFTETIGPPTVDTLTTGTITIGPPTTPTAPTTTAATTTVPTTTAPTTTGPGGIISWPAGRDGFTVVLRSTPTSEGRGPADATAQQARNAGLPEVGVLNSSEYSSLNPGYYVTFAGVHSTKREAENALPRARSAGFPTAYVREVSD